MRKSIPLESQSAPGQPSQKTPPACVHTPLVVLAAVAALFALQSVAQVSAAQTPSKPQAATASKPPAPTASKAVAPAPAHKPVQRRKHPGKSRSLAAKAPVTPPPVVTPPPPEPPHWPVNDRPAEAYVSWDSHGLLISAQNSSLKQILDDVAARIGAKVEGLGADQRIFGSYGPGSAHEVLTQLLDGTGYNVLMIGDQGEGTPRQIVLTSRGATNANTQTAAANNAPQPAASAQEEEPEPPAEEPAEEPGARRLGRHGSNDHNPPQP